MGKYFGTDGVRGIANEKLTAELAFKIGKAGAYILTQSRENKTILVGKDTRISGDMLEAALIAGICAAGATVLKTGVLPTPAIAFLTRKLDAAGGIVISASHNPVADNGIKFFGSAGFKLPDATEELIEKWMVDWQQIPSPTGVQIGRVEELKEAEDLYLDFLTQVIQKDYPQLNLSGLKVVLDCANGSASRVAPRLLKQMGVQIISTHNQPDGTNINANCGSTHPESLMERVKAEKADLGLAFDGDADRLLAVDHLGNLVDGDQIMVICAKFLHEKNRLPQDTVVVTVMSNLGLHLAFRKAGIKTIVAAVGDRYVLEECLKNQAKFGGEQSGHIVFLEHNTTGDGLLTALELLAVVAESGQSLLQLAAQMERLPQVLKNVKVQDKQAVMQSSVLTQAIAEQEKLLQGQGRILVRPSGTESLVRVMIEGKNLEQLHQIADNLCKLISKL